MKKVLILTAILALLVALCACTGQKKESESTTAGKETDKAIESTKTQEDSNADPGTDPGTNQDASDGWTKVY